MTELELKYGCNPNQKPSRIFLRNKGDLPLTMLDSGGNVVEDAISFNAKDIL